MSGQYLALDVVNRDFLFFFGDFDFFCFFCWGQFLEFGHLVGVGNGGVEYDVRIISRRGEALGTCNVIPRT